MRLIVPALALMLLISCSRDPKSVSEERVVPASAADQRSLTEKLAVACSQDQFKQNGMRSDPELGSIFFAHPQSQCALPIPKAGGYLRFSFGLFETARIAVPPTDGVNFRVLAQDASGKSVPIWERFLKPASVREDRGPQQAMIRLDGGSTNLIFETSPGPNTTNDWAYWRNIQLDREIDALKILAENTIKDQFKISGLRQAGSLGQILFAHPSSEFALPLIGGAQSMKLKFGILDGAIQATPPTDGVEFRISIESVTGRKQIWSRTLKPVATASDRGPQDATVSLKTVQGRRLIFETLPVKEWQNNWAYWSSVHLETSPMALMFSTGDGSSERGTQAHGLSVPVRLWWST